ncbi:hypothetical protein [Shewanella saliphila]|uniref:hypothetical protein n=1 Tax=Shewanella saliphila TaxID=2282698 RepID=UPI001665D261|nr:hypothetical protein [Shewanella saliphila]MCL1102181.1 hypothetical protein [Shewanella saliphila]
MSWVYQRIGQKHYAIAIVNDKKILSAMISVQSTWAQVSSVKQRLIYPFEPLDDNLRHN